MSEPQRADRATWEGELFRLLVENVRDYAIFIVDPGGLVRSWSHGAGRLLGYAEAEVLGRPGDIFFTPEDIRDGAPARELREALETGRGPDDRWHVRKDGTRFWASGVTTALRDGSGRIRGFAKIMRDRTEWWQAEQSRREGEARKAAVLETALDAIITIDHRGEVVEFNPAAERMFGYSRADVLGRDLAGRIIPPRLRDAHHRGLARYLASGEGPVLGRRIEIEAIRGDGTEFPVELAICRVPAGGPPQFTAYLRDITERKAGEGRRAAQLAITQVLADAPSVRDAAPRILRAICEHLAWDVGAFWAVDREAGALRCVDVWRPASARFDGFEAISRGHSFASGVGLPGRAWATGEPTWLTDVTEEANFPRRAAAGAAGLHGAFAFPIAAGPEVLGVLEFLSGSIRQPDADLLAMMAGLGGQLGQFLRRTQAEEDLRLAHAELETRVARRTAELARANEFLNALLESIQDGIVACDAEGVLTQFNRATLEFHGLPPEPLPADRWAEHYRLYRADGVTPMTREEVPLFRALQGERLQGVEMVIASNRGAVRTLLASGQAFHDDRGDRLGAVVSMHDITARKAAEASLRTAHEELEKRVVERTAELARANDLLREADRSKDEFLATLAHELRNPLAPIRNALHMMRLPAGDGRGWEAERAMAERQVVHLARLIDDLMDVARISRGEIQLRGKVVDLATVVNHAVETARPQFDDRRHRLTVSVPEGAIRLEADPTRLEQILWNLLNNAAKYTEPGGQVALSAGRDGGEVVIRVRDTGMGIDPALLPKVFDMFFQVGDHKGYAQGGLGIGLGLVRKLVQMHGGSITARSEGPGTGSEFVVRLPALPPTTEVGGPTAAPRREPGGPPPRRRVLVVDDNVDAARSLARLLTKLHGQEVRVAHDGPEALGIAAEFRPEVVLLDIGLPGMDGYEVARTLRQRPESGGTLIVALTGWGQDEDVGRSRAAGIDHHLVKPADPEVIRGLLVDSRASPPRP